MFSVGDKIIYGDANCDGFVNLADTVMIIQATTNPDRYSLTPEGANNADVYERGDGVDKFDALVNDLSQGIPAEIEARKKQYEYYRDKLLNFKPKVA